MPWSAQRDGRRRHAGGAGRAARARGDARRPRGERGRRADRGRGGACVSRCGREPVRGVRAPAGGRGRGAHGPRRRRSRRRGSARATASASTCATTSTRSARSAGISLAAGATRSGLTVVMRRGLSLRGVAKDEEGRPLAGVEVTLSAHAQPARGPRRHADLDDRPRQPGAARDRGRRPLRVPRTEGRASTRSRLGAPGSGARASIPVEVAEAGVEPVTLVLRPGATVTGLVRDRSRGRRAPAGTSPRARPARAAPRSAPTRSAPRRRPAPTASSCSRGSPRARATTCR